MLRYILHILKRWEYTNDGFYHQDRSFVPLVQLCLCK